MLLDKTKPVQTRNGQPVRIITWTEGHPDYPIIGLIGDDRFPIRWACDGKYDKDNPRHDEADLINAPTKKQGWIYLYRTGGGNILVSCTISTTEEEAIDFWKGYSRINSAASLIGYRKIEWEE